MEESVDFPRVDGLGAHQELGRDAQLAKEKAKELSTLNDVQLIIVPKLALAATERLPGALDREREELGAARV